jgi:hypothetical protein
MRGAASDWAATASWTLDRLVLSEALSATRSKQSTVRIAPSLNFTFCELSHPEVLRGALNPPR